ncbi:NADP-dependent oxidoreductase [Steroidobacter flavus]|uniref:NADP-dependent oxidoreductase n=1 Tax=Steroidobacter flavus TaxID=1842136 RepID=A0ABV8SU27_9GAMM
MATMYAIQQQAWGGPDQLRRVELGRPSPLPTEILVRIEAAGVNPVDVFTREGKAYMRALSLPHIPGWDMAGVVEAVGYGVTRFKPGDEVFGMPWFPRAGGAYAEYAVAPSRHFAHKPAELDFVHAAALPLAGLTAWQMLVDVAELRSGMRVLINGGAGGVGHLAIQIAKYLGAHVIATARTEKHEFCRMLGADEVFDYTTTPIQKSVQGVDVVIELVGGETCLAMLPTLRKGGLLISAQAAWVPELQSEAAARGVRATSYLVEPDADGLEALAALVKIGELSPHVQAVFPLDQVASAHALISQRRVTGKLVLAVWGH